MSWTLRYTAYEPEHESLREALCTLGNGYLATRGAAPESRADGSVHYPGTYVIGLYNRLTSEVSGREVENEDLVNLPNWLTLDVRLDDSDWLTLDDVEILDFHQELDLRRAVLTRQVEVRDDRGRETRIVQRRLVHMEYAHVAALETTVLACNWSGHVTVRSGLDGTIANTGVERYRDLANRHLEVKSTGAQDPDIVHLTTETNQSRVRIAQAARTRAHRDGEPIDVQRDLIDDDGFVAHELVFEVAQDEAVTVEKVATLFTGRDRAISEPSLAARDHAARASGFASLLQRHVLAWDRLWDRFGIDLDIRGDAGDTGEGDGHGIDDRAQVILRLHVLHLLQTVSPHSRELDGGAPARGLHGEAYRGHVFWDELFLFPILNLRVPAVSRVLLRYRHRRLNAARRLAREEGLAGALYPWQSGSDGREESQRIHLNPMSGEWGPDHSRLQRHVNHAIAYNVWQYWQVTGDLDFLRYHGAEMLIEISRMLASLTSYDRTDDRYHIRGVMGPDEYHEAYPDADHAGIDDNTYTNVMTVWVLLHALELLELLPPVHRRELEQAVDLRREEIDLWSDITRRMYVPFHDGILSQFEGFSELQELDWNSYRQQYGDIHRLDRILKAEGDTPDHYQLSKQADVLMLFFLLPVGEVQDLLAGLGYHLDDHAVERTVRYHLARTSHGSTLSRVVHSWVLARLDHPDSWALFIEALESDVSDVQGGTTAEGIHLGAMAGTVDIVQRAYAGLSLRRGVLCFDPALPRELEQVRFTLHFLGHLLDVSVGHRHIRVESRPSGSPPISVELCGDVHELPAGQVVEQRWAEGVPRSAPGVDISASRAH